MCGGRSLPPSPSSPPQSPAPPPTPAEVAFGRLASLRRSITDAENELEQRQTEMDAIVADLSQVEELLVTNEDELMFVGRHLHDFHGKLYVHHTVSRDAVQDYRLRHPDVEVIANVVIAPEA